MHDREAKLPKERIWRALIFKKIIGRYLSSWIEQRAAKKGLRMGAFYLEDLIPQRGKMWKIKEIF